MTKAKVSATVDPDRSKWQEAHRLRNTSEVLDRGLRALIEDQLERAQADGYARLPQGTTRSDRLIPTYGPTFPGTRSERRTPTRRGLVRRHPR